MLGKMLSWGTVVVFCACVAACGGGTTKVETGDQITTGQQLIDLQKARESGAITDRQYEDAKKKILRSM